ncbi:MAG: hypothetical protein KBF73_03310 [Flavobacteriales bacterium]|nr:hypothetical protein [Flavobacteriales bacterium]
MNHKKNILQFQFGELKAIGMNHFEQRRGERTKATGTDIFSKHGLNDHDAILECFRILERDRYEKIHQSIEYYHPEKVEFIVGFQTDEVAENGRDSIYIFIVFSISEKLTAMNGIQEGEKFLSCITVVKDTHKKKCGLRKGVFEVSMCCCTTDEGELEWRSFVPRI